MFLCHKAVLNIYRNFANIQAHVFMTDLLTVESYRDKKQSCLQDCPPAAGCFSNIYSSAAVRSNAERLFSYRKFSPRTFLYENKKLKLSKLHYEYILDNFNCTYRLLYIYVLYTVIAIPTTFIKQNTAKKISSKVSVPQ